MPIFCLLLNFFAYATFRTERKTIWNPPSSYGVDERWSLRQETLKKWETPWECNGGGRGEGGPHRFCSEKGGRAAGGRDLFWGFRILPSQASATGTTVGHDFYGKSSVAFPSKSASSQTEFQSWGRGWAGNCLIYGNYWQFFEFSVLPQLVHFNPTNRFVTHLKQFAQIYF